MNPQVVVLGLISRGETWFLQRRALEARRLPGCWEFPGGKVEPWETPEAALLRELAEEIGWRPEAWRPLPVLEAGALHLHPYLCRGSAEPSSGLAWGWFTRIEAARLRIPEPNHRLLQGLPDGPW